MAWVLEQLTMWRLWQLDDDDDEEKGATGGLHLQTVGSPLKQTPIAFATP